MEEKKKEEIKEEIIVKKDNKEHKLLRKNNWMKATIIILIFIIILLSMAIICICNKPQEKCVDDSNINKEIETINDFGTRFDEFTIDKDEKKQVKVNGFLVNIDNRQDGTYLNNRKTSFMYASGGYVLDKFLILYSNENKLGKKIIFFDYNLNEISIEDKELLYSNLVIENGKIQANISKYDNTDSCKIFNNFEVCECKDNMEPLVNNKDFLIDFNNEIVEGEVKLVYKGNKIILEYVSKKTVSEYYKSDIDGETKKYCGRKY